MEIQFNLAQLRRRLEVLKGRDFKWEEIATGAGLHPNTLYGLASNKTTRIDMKTLARLVKYFHAQGLMVEVGELFVLLPEGDESAEQPKDRRDSDTADSA